MGIWSEKVAGPGRAVEALHRPARSLAPPVEQRWLENA